MLYIAHRGNVSGPNPKKENTEDYILQALNLGFNCEIDVWVIKNIDNVPCLYLGHDTPDTQTTTDFLLTHKDNLWIHCKNYAALEYLHALQANINYFYHDLDHYTITSKNIVWGNINSPVVKDMICVMPEKYSSHIEPSEIIKCSGICSDYIIQYKHMLQTSGQGV